MKCKCSSCGKIEETYKFFMGDRRVCERCVKSASSIVTTYFIDGQAYIEQQKIVSAVPVPVKKKEMA